jgi:hypothetical protein
MIYNTGQQTSGSIENLKGASGESIANHIFFVTACRLFAAGFRYLPLGAGKNTTDIHRSLALNVKNQTMKGKGETEK